MREAQDRGAAVGRILLLSFPLAAFSLAMDPLERAARVRRRRVESTAVDLSCLLLLLGLSATIVRGLFPKLPAELAMIVYLFGGLSWAYLWWGSVAILSRAGVIRFWHRTVFLLVVLPWLIVGTFAQVAVWVWLGLSCRSLSFSRVAMPHFLGAVVSQLVLPWTFFACTRFTQHLAVIAEEDARETDGPEHERHRRAWARQLPWSLLAKKLRYVWVDLIPWRLLDRWLQVVIRRLTPVVRILLLGAPVNTFSWVMAPLERAVVERHKPAQFTIADLLCLFFLVHLSSTVVYYVFSESPRGYMLVIYIFGWCSWGALWWASVGKLSQASVTNPWHRAIFLLVVLPLLTLGTVAQVAILVWLVRSLVSTLLWNPAAVFDCLASLASGAGLLLSFVASAWFIRRMVAVAGEEKPNVDSGNQENQEAAR